MKKLSMIFLFGFFVLAATYLMYAGTQTKTTVKANAQERVRTNTQNRIALSHGYGFIDEDGDGINDYARDDDGDGIPNGLDPDFVRPMDGSGRRSGYGNRGNRRQFGAGGGNCVDCNEFNHNWGGNNGTGVCDGSGPHGNRSRRKGGKN